MQIFLLIYYLKKEFGEGGGSYNIVYRYFPENFTSEGDHLNPNVRQEIFHNSSSEKWGLKRCV
jgi:hypothetical protein